MLTGELVIKGKQGDAFFTAARTRAVQTFTLTIQIDADNSLSLEGNSVRIPADAGVTADYDESGPILTIPLRFDYNATDARAFRWTVINGIEDYLLTT